MAEMKGVNFYFNFDTMDLLGDIYDYITNRIFDCTDDEEVYEEFDEFWMDFRENSKSFLEETLTGFLKDLFRTSDVKVKIDGNFAYINVWVPIDRAEDYIEVYGVSAEEAVRKGADISVDDVSREEAIALFLDEYASEPKYQEEAFRNIFLQDASYVFYVLETDTVLSDIYDSIPC